MNEKFFLLPEEKQQKIINAGFLVFSQNSYQKSPMQEAADRAGISKSLLFHYFQNKKEFYLFLWEQACKITFRYLTEYGCYEPADLFEMMERGMRAKLEMMRSYPNMTAFAIKAFYERNPEISGFIQESYRKHFDIKAKDALSRVNPEDFIPGLDLEMMYREMYLSSEGYLWEAVQQGEIPDVEKLEADFKKLLVFWKKVYLKKTDGEKTPRDNSQKGH